MAAPQPQRVFVEGIKSKLLRPALTSHYVCEFKPPSPFMDGFLSARNLNYNSNIQELIQLSCCDASLPGASLMTNEINDDHTGVTERHAYRRQYDDRSDFTFYVDRDYTIIKFFESWIAYVVGENDQIGLKNRNYFYRSYFPGEYQSDNLYITKFERDYAQNKNLKYQFIGAYPISISSMPVSYESSQVLKCTVSFTYIRYLIDSIQRVAAPSQSITPTTSGDPSAPQTSTETITLYGSNQRDVVVDINRPTLNQLVAQ